MAKTRRALRKYIDMDEVKQKYAAGVSLLDIARNAGVTHRTITERLKMEGVKIRGIQEAWNEDERRASASVKSRNIRAAKIAEESSYIFDPSNYFSETEKLILSRLRDGAALVPVDICQNRWPNLKEMAVWFSILRLSRAGYIYEHERCCWAITGCGRLFCRASVASNGDRA